MLLIPSKFYCSAENILYFLFNFSLHVPELNSTCRLSGLFHVVPCCRFYLLLFFISMLWVPLFEVMHICSLNFFLLSRYYSNSSDLCLFFCLSMLQSCSPHDALCWVLGVGVGMETQLPFFLFLIWNVLRHLIPQNKIKYKLNKNTLHACGSGLTLWYSRKHFLENSWGDLQV